MMVELYSFVHVTLAPCVHVMLQLRFRPSGDCTFTIADETAMLSRNCAEIMTEFPCCADDGTTLSEVRVGGDVSVWMEKSC